MTTAVKSLIQGIIKNMSFNLQKIESLIDELRSKKMSDQQICDELNDKGFKSTTGKTFNRSTIGNIIQARRFRNKGTSMITIPVEDPSPSQKMICIIGSQEEIQTLIQGVLRGS